MPAKGVRPVFTGVKGELVDAVPPEVHFGPRGRISPYDAMLQKLKAAGPGKFLRFDDLKAKASVWARARKMGIKVLFGEQGNTLWVMLAKTETEIHEDGVVTLADRRIELHGWIERAIGARRHTAGEMVSWIRSNGGPGGIGISEVDRGISEMARGGKIKLRTMPKGTEGPEKWDMRVT